MTNLNYVGKPAQRVDALDKVMGKAKYVGDMTLPGMLYARTLRSEVPHARIVKLDVSPALKVPGVISVTTSEDRITSYNVCYTKLLRVTLYPKRPRSQYKLSVYPKE